ncbi:MAG: InlB B-repeat-containing protein, partial [Bacteroidales bacterium]|nr:InlB B-repeat-containing protein [Bacteroidales bacterium]
MKKFLVSFLMLLLLGSSLAWGAITVSGTITVEATDAEKSELSGLKLIVGLFMGGKDVSMLQEFSLPASTYTLSSYFGGDIFFGIGSDKKMAYDDNYKSNHWVIVDENGQELNPMTLNLKADAEVNLTIKYKSTPKASLIGKVLEGGDCLAGVFVSLSNGMGGIELQTTQSDPDKYSDKVGCSIGYEFTNLELGTYTLRYSKEGYSGKSQTVEITEAGETIAPEVTLEAEPLNYKFSGTLSYTNADDETVYVQGAAITAYDGAGEEAEVLGTPVQTDGEGAWEMTLLCTIGTTVYFGAEHPDIEVAGRAAAQAANYMGKNEVTINCTPKPVEPIDPPVVEKDSFDLHLLVNDAEMGTVTGDGRYEENTEVTIKAIPNEGYVFQAWKTQDGETEISKNAEYRFILSSDSTLKAFFAAKPVDPVDPVDPPVVKDSVTLTLEMNDTTMGMVQGKGKYEKGQQVTIKAVPNEGYEFRIWMEGDMVISMTAEYTFVLDADRTFTAMFVAQFVQNDSATLTLEVNDAKMGKVEGAGKYANNTEVTIKATANEGYVFVAWISGNDTVAKTAEYKLTLVSDSTLTAVFALKTSNEELEQAAWNVFAENQTIVLCSKAACQYDVYNMAGTLVEHVKTNANEYRIAVNNSGMYIIRRISATGI